MFLDRYGHFGVRDRTTLTTETTSGRTSLVNVENAKGTLTNLKDNVTDHARDTDQSKPSASDFAHFTQKISLAKSVNTTFHNLPNDEVEIFL